MKVIKVIKGFVFTSFDENPAKIEVKNIDSVLHPFEQNKLKIIDCAFVIEGIIERIIAHYFFGQDKTTKSARKNFESLILSSDWCSFSSKRKLLLHIISEKDLLKGKDRSNYEYLLKKVMSYRNAFTHGEVLTDGKKIKIKYYEGEPKDQLVDDEFLTKIEINLNECFNITEQLSNLIGASIPKNK